MQKEKTKSFIQPIILILAAAFIVRLNGIGASTVGRHSWRQADTAAMARNFFENRFNILFPQVDWGGVSSGYAETEFPIYSFMVAISYRLFGVHEYIPRLMSVIFFLISVYFIFSLANELWDKKCALWAAGFLAFLPMPLFYSRAIMPESMLVMGISGGVYFFHRWYKDGKSLPIVAAAVLISLAVSIKPPSLYLILPLGYLAWLRLRFRLFVNPHIWLFFLIMILPSALWYFHAHQIYLDTKLTFNIWGYGEDKWGIWSLPVTSRFWRQIVLQHFAGGLAYFGALIFLAGFVLKRKTKVERFLDLWLVALLVYVLIVAGGVYAHEYYLLPAMLPVALFMGKAFGKLTPGLKKPKDVRQALMLLLLAGVTIFSVAIFFYALKVENPDTNNITSERMKLAETIQKISEPGDLVIVVDESDPTLLYLCHRKGWRMNMNSFNTANLSDYRDMGARYVIGFNSEGTFILDLKQ
ncbi:MAG: glycosyltransferase family 39 protein [Thermoleophilia bacterium]|nr:glycosyltransferase family 39 protein [Thermoleophilia bacterium]